MVVIGSFRNRLGYKTLLLKNQNGFFKTLKAIDTAIISDAVNGMPIVVRMKGNFLDRDLISDSEFFGWSTSLRCEKQLYCDAVLKSLVF